MARPFVYENLPAIWPLLPDEVSSVWCHWCCWAWVGGAMKLKYIHRGCEYHGRYLG